MRDASGEKAPEPSGAQRRVWVFQPMIGPFPWGARHLLPV
jgi:hypothetical protein